MKRTHLTRALVALLAREPITAATSTDKRSDPQTFTIDLSKDVPRLLELVNQTRLPEHEEYPGVGASFGFDLGALKSLQHEWTTSFDWEKEQASINQYKQYITTIEGLTIHFIHEKSGDPTAIPLILNHGWPGTFLEFLPVIKPLNSVGKSSTGSSVSFDVIIPSLPGFGFSSAPPANWSVGDTARVFNTLMTQVLGYEKYAVHGTDWGGAVAYSLYNDFNKTARALHETLIPFLPATLEELAAENITLTPDQVFMEQRSEAWLSDAGQGYFHEQTTRPNTIGLALYDNPVGQLAWIADIYFQWSDPRAGTPPSVLTHNEILRAVTLFYLTRSFISAEYVYAQNSGLNPNYTKANTDAPLLFSDFKFALAFWPPQLIDRVGNLVFYQYHDFGGHWAGLENPPALVSDLREIATYWSG